jgi:hypothetical protein
VTRILPILALSAACLVTAGCNQTFRFEAGETPEMPAAQLDDNFVAAANATCVGGATLLGQQTIVITDGTPMAQYRYRCNGAGPQGRFGYLGL